MRTKLHIGMAEYRKLSDEELVHRYKDRNEYKIMNVLFERYGHLVYGLCMEYTRDAGAARGFTEQLFINLLADIKRFHIPEFKTWLLKYTKNYCFRQLNSSLAIEPVNAGEEPKEKIINADDVELTLEAAIKELDAAERRCMDLFYLNNMNYAAIAQATGFSLQQVKQLLQSGKQHLKTKLGAFSYVNYEQAI